MRYYPPSKFALVLTCKCCDHKWIPRFDKERRQYRVPNICPKCKSEYWNAGPKGRNWRRGRKGGWKDAKMAK